MKLKYYLRGLGMGILFATIIMTISSVIHNNNLTDEYIIKEAKKLGMVMANETESEGLFGGTENSDSTEEDSDGAQSTENVQNTEGTLSTESIEDYEFTQTDEELNVGQTGTITVIDGVEYVTIEVVLGDNARQVAERMYVHGLVDHPETFREYIGQVRGGRHLSVGTYSFPKGATYDELIDILFPY